MRALFALILGALAVACEPPNEPKPSTGTHTAKPDLGGAAIVASKNSDKFHRPSCEWAQKITADNLRTYKNAEEAFRAGLKPCEKCKP